MSKTWVVWDNEEKTIIRIDYDVGWTWDDYHKVIDGIAALLQGIEYPTHVISVQPAGTRLPAGAPLETYRQKLAHRPQHMTVYVTADPAMRDDLITYGETRGRKEGQHFWFTATVDEARQLIARNPE
jgi:hypothetical protein